MAFCDTWGSIPELHSRARRPPESTLAVRVNTALATRVDPFTDCAIKEGPCSPQQGPSKFG